jgi:hypothetical protein
MQVELDCLVLLPDAYERTVGLPLCISGLKNPFVAVLLSETLGLRDHRQNLVGIVAGIRDHRV